MSPREMSPGPSWAVLTQPTSSTANSSPSTRASLRSDCDLDMGDDEADTEHRAPPIPKRKADDSLAGRKPPKLPRLDPLASLSSRPAQSQPLASGSASVNRPGPSRTQASSSSAPARPRPANSHSNSDSSNSDFPGTISQTVKKTNELEKEREQARQRARERQAVANPIRHQFLGTARKQTTQPKNIGRVSTKNLLQNAQRLNDSSASSPARTRVRKRNLRLNHGDVAGRSKPLETARQRAEEIIELNDSTDSARRPSQSTNARPRQNAPTNEDEVIVLSSGSENDRVIAISSQRRPPSSTQANNKSRPANRNRAPPPPDVEVISLSDSEDDTVPRPAAPTSQPLSPRPRPSASTASAPNLGVNPVVPPPRPSQQAHTTPSTITVPASAPVLASTAAPVPTTTPVPTRTPIATPQPAPMPASQPAEVPPTPLEDTSQPNPSPVPQTSLSPTYDPPPNDFDFDNFDIGDDGIQNDLELEELDMGSSFTPPSFESPSAPAPVPVSASVRETTEDAGGQDSLFDSYINMDELERAGDQEMLEVPKSGGPTSEGGVGAGAADLEKVVEEEVVAGPEDSTREEGELSQDVLGRGQPSTDIDVPMSLEEGEVDSNDILASSTEAGVAGSEKVVEKKPLPALEEGELPQVVIGSGEQSKDTDVRMTPEADGVDPNDMLAPVTQKTPSSGEIAEDASGKQPPQKPDLPKLIPPPRVSLPVPSKLGSTPTIADLAQPTPTLATLASVSSTPVKPPSSSFPSISRTSTLVMPDISSYKSVRFKRSLPEARENSFFSRALIGARSTRDVLGSPEGANAKGKGENNAAEVASPPARALPSVEPIQEERRVEGDTEMEDTPSQETASRPMSMSMAEHLPSPSLSRSHQGDDASVSSEGETSKGVQGEPSTIAVPSIDSDASLKTVVEAPMPIGPSPKLLGPSQIPDARNVLPTSEAAPTPMPPQANVVETPQVPATPGAAAPTRPVIPPPRIPRVHTPMSLVDTLNDVFTGRALRESMATKRGPTDATDGPASSSKTIVEDQNAPSSSRADAEAPSQMQPQLATPVRPVGKTPSLDNIRSLLAKRNFASSQVQRTTPLQADTPAESSTSAALKDARMDANDAQPVTINASGHLNTPAPSSSGSVPRTTETVSARKRHTPLVPFEAFISPVQPRSVPNGKGKEKAVSDPFASPTLPRLRASLGIPLWGSQRDREPTRRQSASAAFEGCIVRDEGSGSGSGRMLPRPPRPPRPLRFSEGVRSVSSSSVSSPSVPEVVPRASVDTGSGGEGEDGSEDIAPEDAMQVDRPPAVAGEVAEDPSKTVADAPGVQEQNLGAEEEGNEMDQLLELASVHLSQEEPEIANARMDVAMNDGVDAAMDVDGEIEDVLKAIGVPSTVEAQETAQILVDVGTGPVDQAATAQEMHTDARTSIPIGAEETAGTGQPSLEVNLDSDNASNPVDSPLPELILPEWDGSTESGTEEPVPVSVRSRSPRNEVPPTTHRRLRGPRRFVDDDDVDSAEECVAILEGEDDAGSGSEGGHRGAPSGAQEERVGSVASSQTASSTSLHLPPPPRVSRRRRSKRRSASADASSVDPLDTFKSEANRPRAAYPEVPPATESHDEYIGGYRVIAWKSFSEAQRNCPPEYKRSKDLPHELQDHMNALPVELRNSDFGRKVFEAHIRCESAAELDAPPIEIFDNEIGDEATPQWEFHYTNEMWHGEGVDPPDIRNLKSCECVGKCDTKSGTCACAKKQMHWLKSYIEQEILPAKWPGAPFVYDHKGVLQMFECPIFECNLFCACDEDCPNRVVQNGRKWPVHIAKTEHKGWGVFAGARKIPKGSYLGIYAGELLTEGEADERGKYYDLYGRTYLFSIDFHHLKMDKEEDEEWDNLYVVDAYHAGNFTRFLNHSCDPNCKIFACYIDDADINKPLLAVFTTRDTEPYEELCFSYYGDIDEKRLEIEELKGAGEESVRDLAVYARCRCGADNCIGRLFS